MDLILLINDLQKLFIICLSSGELSRQNVIILIMFFFWECSEKVRLLSGTGQSGTLANLAPRLLKWSLLPKTIAVETALPLRPHLSLTDLTFGNTGRLYIGLRTNHSYSQGLVNGCRQFPSINLRLEAAPNSSQMTASSAKRYFDVVLLAENCRPFPTRTT